MSLSEEVQKIKENMATEKCGNEACGKITEKLFGVIEEYQRKLEDNKKHIDDLESKIKVLTDDRDLHKTQYGKLEKKLEDALRIPEAQEILTLKSNQEEMLTRAKELLFEKTKICKNQELQIEALNQQITSLKEVVNITKDLLEIRNLETKHLQEKLEGMESKIACEKERHELMNKKLERMIEMNGEVKREYETQLVLFNALREKYSERELARGVLSELRGSAGDASAGVAAVNGTGDGAGVGVATANEEGDLGGKEDGK